MDVKFISLFTAGVLAASLVSPGVMADPLSPDQKKEIEQMMHDYLVNNPEVLIEASQALQQRQQKNMQEQAKASIVTNTDQLFNEKLSVAGNPKGKVTLVEFFDYQCIHCKKMNTVINDLIKQDPNLFVIYKEFPIFGKSSEFASQVALAAGMQNKYLAMHDALLALDKNLNDTLVLDTAKSVGLDMEKLKKDMASQTVKDAMDANRQLAEKMHLMGTPAFVVAATDDGKLKPGTEPVFIPGVASAETLKDFIKKLNG